MPERERVHIIDLMAPVVPEDLPQEDIDKFLSLTRTILSGAVVTKADLTGETRRYLAYYPSAAIGFKTVAGIDIYPTFQFDDWGKIHPLVSESTIRFGRGVDRALWWYTPIDNLGGKTPAVLLVEGSALSALKNLIKPPVQKPLY